jgi:hypothetical protein
MQMAGSAAAEMLGAERVLVNSLCDCGGGGGSKYMSLVGGIAAAETRSPYDLDFNCPIPSLFLLTWAKGKAGHHTTSRGFTISPFLIK